MEHTAATPEGKAHDSRVRAFVGDVGPKLFITIVAAGITALLIPWITGTWQDHKQQLEVRTSLASDMSRAYTDVIASERFVAFGLVYSATERPGVIASAKRYIGRSGIDWSGLEHTKRLKTYPDFKSSYTALGNELLARGDALVQEELKLTPHV